MLFHILPLECDVGTAHRPHPLPQVLDEDDVALVQVNGAMTNLIFRAQNLLTSEVGC